MCWNFRNLGVIKNSRMKLIAAIVLMLYALACTTTTVEARTNRQHQEISTESRFKDYKTTNERIDLDAPSSIPGQVWRKTSNEARNKTAEHSSGRLSFNGNQNRNHNTWRTTSSLGQGPRRSGGAAVPSSYPEWPVRRYHSSDRSYDGGVTAPNGKNHILRDVEEFGGWDGKSFNPESSTTAAPPVITTRGRNHHKNHDGRHICMQHKTIHIPVKTTEVYTRPTWKHVSEPCQSNQICTRVQLVHEPAVRDVIRHKTTRQITYDCCAGWEQLTKTSNSCMKPICKNKCQNGGSCTQPEVCSCPKGFTGKYCERDINECKEEKPCDQLCYNTEGSYYCKCREGFILHTDMQSCKKIGGGIDDAFEARDLENEIETTEELGSRLQKIEKMLANDRVETHELNRAMEATSHTISSLKTRLSTLEQRQQDISSLQNKLIVQDAKTKKLEHLISILFKCKTNPQPYCP